MASEMYAGKGENKASYWIGNRYNDALFSYTSDFISMLHKMTMTCKVQAEIHLILELYNMPV